jgi:DEAD/DEAH box helicase domain-containing protein
MTNDQTKMTKEFPKPKNSDLRFGHSSFFRHSDLGIGRFPRVGMACEKARKSQIVNRKLGPMARNIVYFDLETQKSADEVGGWGNISKMGMSVGVTCSSATGEYKIYGEPQVNALITELQRADLVVGFNNLRFDYEVLHGYSTFDLSQVPTLDMLVELQNTLGHRLSLDSIATATFGVEKTAEGLQAIRWFKEGKLAEIAEYCCYDVKITKLVHEYGAHHRQLHYTNKFGKKMTVPVKW